VLALLIGIHELLCQQVHPLEAYRVSCLHCLDAESYRKVGLSFMEYLS
jgi:hypothetical protein